jgi:hypothetical protein
MDTTAPVLCARQRPASYADVHRVFSETETFKSEMPRGPGWEQFNKIMFAQFVTQMDVEQPAVIRSLRQRAQASYSER